MKAKYIKPAYCSACLDLGFDDIDCIKCQQIRTKEVEVLSFGDGLFGNKATIKYPNGKLDTVYIDSLKIID